VFHEWHRTYCKQNRGNRRKSGCNKVATGCSRGLRGTVRRPSGCPPTRDPRTSACSPSSAARSLRARGAASLSPHPVAESPTPDHARTWQFSFSFSFSCSNYIYNKEDGHCKCLEQNRNGDGDPPYIYCVLCAASNPGVLEPPRVFRHKVDGERKTAAQPKHALGHG
jgi:hypothetical protein